MADQEYPIPQTNALRQVNRYSLQELFSRDPETLGESLHDVIVHMQELRERLASTETVRQVRAIKTSPSQPSLSVVRNTRTVTSAAELGFVKKPAN